MRRLLWFLSGAIWLGVCCASAGLYAQDTKSAAEKPDKSQPSPSDPKEQRAYSGMYSFLKDGEFLQLTVEDGGNITGFVSRYGNGESDKGAFLDQFFKTGKLDGNKLTLTTEVVHGVAFDFQGTVERGDGKNPGDEAYFILKGTLTENISDANKKVNSRSRPVVFKMFPQDTAPAPSARQ
ncbi:MAG TPA: hypothetical protein VMS18_13985 [Candidatus Binatia bacterium]|nr:hypothetical protein [Candidatus Binatia bacterium]